jgi:two-component system chemotaxis response regulator CheB
MEGHDTVVIGASAGGVEALVKLVGQLPADLPAHLLVVLHVASDHTSLLPRILNNAGPLPAAHAKHGERPLPGHIYVAPPDRHLLVHGGTLRLSAGPSEGGHRPAVDRLFRSAARACGRRVVGIVLSGALDDGTAGLIAIKQHGGVCVVQDPIEALVGDMPRSALENVAVDHCLLLVQIASLIDRLARETLETGDRASEPPPLARAAPFAPDGPGEQPRSGEHPRFSCPVCGGALEEGHRGGPLRFRCQIGHAFDAAALREENQQALEGALWAALRALEEQAALANRMAVHAREQGHGKSAKRFEIRASSVQQQAAMVRDALRRGLASPADESVEPLGAS